MIVSIIKLKLNCIEFWDICSNRPIHDSIFCLCAKNKHPRPLYQNLFVRHMRTEFFPLLVLTSENGASKNSSCRNRLAQILWGAAAITAQTSEYTQISLNRSPYNCFNLQHGQSLSTQFWNWVKTKQGEYHTSFISQFQWMLYTQYNYNLVGEVLPRLTFSTAFINEPEENQIVHCSEKGW